MTGRYGTDNFGRFLNIVVLILMIFGMFYALFSVLGIALFAFVCYRMFSRDASRRSRENQAYLGLRAKAMMRINELKRRFTERGTHRFFRCPTCRQTLRVPRGKGNITITCPKCQNQFRKKS